MRIFIPSRGRASWEKQVTLRQLVDAGIAASLVVPEAELDDYTKFYDGSSVKIYGCPNNGIGRVREWILNRFSLTNVLMLDDDMYFYRRPKMSSPKLVRTTRDTTRDMLAAVAELLRVHPMVGISARQGNNNVDTWMVENTRAMNAYAFDPSVLAQAGIAFGRMTIMEDFDITLQLLRKGYSNAVLYRYCWNQVGSNSTGGCSDYRTAEMQAKAARKLKRLHPKFVTLVEKEAKSTWKGMEKRLDVRIAWKKAAAEGARC